MGVVRPGVEVSWPLRVIAGRFAGAVERYDTVVE